MSLTPIFRDEPWGFLLDSELNSNSGKSPTVSGAGSPRVFAPVGSTLTWGGSAGRAPRAGPTFMWNGIPHCSWHVPAGHLATSRRDNLELHWRSVESGSEGRLLQVGLLQRPEVSDEESDAAKQSRLIDWLVHSFQELGQDQLAEDDAAAGGVVRRTWNRAVSVWLSPDANEPRIELIIRMAQDKALIATLASISSNPRRILVRVREQTPLSRVKELDVACIRRYSRLPGRDAIEKAGTRQELLAVQRRPSHDTLENRVTAWTLENLLWRSERWKRIQAKGNTRQGARFRSVATLARHAAAYRAAEGIVEAKTSALSHPVPANYPLMMEPRYKRVYSAYRELLRYEKIKDDAWTWRRVLWSEAVTQLISCTLRQLFSEGENHSSSPYYRTEPDRGRWLLAPASAGPFATSMGPLFVIDVHEADLNPDGTLRPPLGQEDPVWRSIGMLGCEIILWWPSRKLFFPVWAVLWTGSLPDWKRCLGSASLAIDRFQQHLTERRSLANVSRGLVIGTSLERSSVDIDSVCSGGATAIGIPVPMEIDTQNAKSFAAIAKALSEAIELAVDLPK